MLRSGEELIGSIMYNSRIDKLSYRDGSIEEFFSRKTFVFFGKDTETRNKMIDRDILQEFVTPGELEKLITYSEGSNLKFKRKDDFLKILEYYDTLIEN